jgi:hypothetical protein
VNPARRGYRTPNAPLLIALLVVVVGAIVYLSRRSRDSVPGNAPTPSATPK